MKHMKNRLIRLLALSLALVLMLPMLSGCSDIDDIQNKIKYLIGWKGVIIPIATVEETDEFFNIKYEDGYVKKLSKKEILDMPVWYETTADGSLAACLFGGVSSISLFAGDQTLNGVSVKSVFTKDVSEGDYFNVGRKKYEIDYSIYRTYLQNNLTSVEIDGSVDGVAVTAIGAYGFSNAVALTSVSIPASVTEIGEGAFLNCSALTEIKVHEDNPSFCSIDGNLYSKDGSRLIQYAAGKSSKSFVAPEGVEAIAVGAFNGAVQLEELTIPYLGSADHSFAKLDKLFGVRPVYVHIAGEDIILNNGNTVKYEGNLDDVYLSPDQYVVDFSDDSVTVELDRYSSSYRFPSDEQIYTIHRFDSNSVSDISRADYALKSIRFTKITTLPQNCFANWEKLETVSLPVSLIFIGENCFRGCTGLKTIVYEGTLEQWNTIQKNSLWNSDLQDITIQCSNGTIGE